MTPKYVLEQLRRYQEGTEWEDEDTRRWMASGGRTNDYMLIHNQGHKIAVEAVRGMLLGMKTLDKDAIKKFAKMQIVKCDEYMKAVDATDTGADDWFDDKYFRTDGVGCGYRTVLEILREEIYFEKNPQRQWMVDTIPYMKARYEKRAGN